MWQWKVREHSGELPLHLRQRLQPGTWRQILRRFPSRLLLLVVQERRVWPAFPDAREEVGVLLRRHEGARSLRDRLGKPVHALPTAGHS